MDETEITVDSVDAKVALDKNYRPIGRIAAVDEERDGSIRIRISPHREFRQKHPEFREESLVLDAGSIAKLWGHNVVLDKDVKDLLRVWKD